MRKVSIFSKNLSLFEVKDTHKEKAPPKKSPSLTNSTYMAIWVVDTSNQLFISGP